MKTSPDLAWKFIAGCSWALLLRCVCLAQTDADPQHPNLLVNGSFEKGTEGWDGGNSAQVTAKLDPAQPHAGHSSMRVDNVAPTDTSFLQAVPVKPATRYRLSGWLKATKILMADGQYREGVGASLDATGVQQRSQVVSNTTEWAHVAMEFNTNTKTAVRVGLRIGDYGKRVTGTVWLADVSLVELGSDNIAGAPAGPPAAPSANLFTNGSFEKGMEGWTVHPKSPQVTATIDPEQRHDGHPSVRVENTAPKASGVFQIISVKPATRYRFTGWAKAGKIVKGEGEKEGEVGACLGVIMRWDHSNWVSDSQEWVQVSVEFNTSPTETELKIGPWLGYYTKAATGTAWFADLSLVELGPVPGAENAKPSAPVANSGPQPANSPIDSSLQAATAGIVKTYHNSLVFVTGTNGSGSGFLAKYGSGDFLFTNAHVAAGVHGAAFKALNGTEVKTGAASCAVGHDVFLLQATTNGQPLEIMQGVDEKAGIGDEVVVLGNAEGAGVINTITGKIVGIGPQLVEVDAPFQPGNSGSPIIHLKSGKVIGVATYAIIRKYDPSTKEPIKDPVIRRFGYRLDSIKSWQPVNWPAFSVQAAEMEAVEKLTTDLSAFLDDLAKNSHVTRGSNNNPVIKNRIDAWLEDRAKKLSPRDAAMADQSFLSFLKITCQNDVAAARQHLTYDYFQRNLADQQRERDEMSAVFDQIIQNLRKEK